MFYFEALANAFQQTHLLDQKQLQKLHQFELGSSTTQPMMTSAAQMQQSYVQLSNRAIQHHALLSTLPKLVSPKYSFGTDSTTLLHQQQMPSTTVGFIRFTN